MCSKKAIPHTISYLYIYFSEFNSFYSVLFCSVHGSPPLFLPSLLIIPTDFLPILPHTFSFQTSRNSGETLQRS